jgi:uncharacterized membrane protein YagU involved in acid resistance
MTAPRTVLIGTFVVGTLDLLDAVIFFGVRNGTTPTRIFQSIAAGWLGRSAFSGGVSAAAMGVLTHYFIAFGIVVVYLLASRAMPVLTRRPWIAGAVYGVVVYFFMNLVVIPISAIGPQRFTLGPFVNGILIHIAGVGIPTALVVRRRGLLA